MEHKVYQSLLQIQRHLKAPKSQYNEFGKYNYRKAEDIMEAVKPMLEEYRCVLTCSDDVIFIDGRHYIKSTVTILQIDDGSSYSTTAYAREEESKKGMDGSQVTGASSSYARKYALNGLFCIDDGVDSDQTNTGEIKQRESTSKQQRTTQNPPKDKRKPFDEKNINSEAVMKWLYEQRQNGVNVTEALTKATIISPEVLQQVIENFQNYIINNNLK